MRKVNGIVVVSFGTSYKETREKNIGAIEHRIAEAFPDFQVYRAFTSQFIRRKIQKAGEYVSDVEEALEAMEEDGITGEVIVQPTYIINGMENDLMLETVKKYQGRFKKISVGAPLLASIEDCKEMAYIVCRHYPVEEDEVLVFMGHGSEQYSNAAYSALEYAVKTLGSRNIYIGTMKGDPSLEKVKQKLKKEGVAKVNLAPLMIAAGAHACNDMAGEKGSWREELEREGYEVRVLLKGLGELEEVQKLFVQHINEARKKGQLKCIQECFSYME